MKRFIASIMLALALLFVNTAHATDPPTFTETVGTTTVSIWVFTDHYRTEVIVSDPTNPLLPLYAGSSPNCDLVYEHPENVVANAYCHTLDAIFG